MKVNFNQLILLSIVGQLDRGGKEQYVHYLSTVQVIKYCIYIFVFLLLFLFSGVGEDQT